MHKHFVTFYSPGTFFAEDTTREIVSWDISAAKAMAADITERYGAKPYGFRFITKSRGPDDLDGKVTAKSGMHYLAGTIETLAEIEARDDPNEDILRSNMRCNGWDRVITSHTPWKWTQPFTKEDVRL